MGEPAHKLERDPRGERGTPRTAIYAKVDLASDHNFWSGLTMNMSEGGLFVATHHEVPVGTVLLLNMLLPFDGEAIVTPAVVRWTRAFGGGEDSPPGLGLQFVELAEPLLAKIRRFVATVREPLFYED